MYTLNNYFFVGRLTILFINLVLTNWTRFCARFCETSRFHLGNLTVESQASFEERIHLPKDLPPCIAQLAFYVFKAKNNNNNFHLKDSDYKFQISSSRQILNYLKTFCTREKTKTGKKANETQSNPLRCGQRVPGMTSQVQAPPHPTTTTTTTATATTILFVHLGGMDSNTKPKLYRNESTGCLK